MFVFEVAVTFSLRKSIQNLMQVEEVVTILIADDHPLVIEGVKSLLATSNHFKIVLEASNGQQAIDLLTTQNHPIDILLLDVNMPLLSGVEVCIKAKQLQPDIKVLLLSMYHNIAVVREALKAEADGFILKNTGKDELIKALDKVANGGTYFSQDILPILTQLVKKDAMVANNGAVLSDREREILSLIVQEYTSEVIGEKLYISKKTVEKHRANILEKTGCKSTIGLVKFALENGYASL